MCKMMLIVGFKLKFHRCDFNNILDTSCDAQIELHERGWFAKVCIFASSNCKLIDSNSTIFLVIVVAVVVINGILLL